MTAGPDPQMISGRVYRPVGYAQYTNLAAMVNLDAAPAAGKRLSTCHKKPMRALIQAEAQGIRWTDDEDVDPTGALGMVIPVGATLEYDGDLSNFRMIEDAAGAIANISYYAI